MSDPLDRIHTDFFPACRDYYLGPPRGQRPKYIVIHCIQADWVPGTIDAENTARYFHTCGHPPGSTQLIVDEDSTQRSVPDDAVAAGAPPLNHSGLHIEQGGVIQWTRVQWLSRVNTITRCAYYTAQWCRTYGIPIRYLHAADLVSLGPDPAQGGITAHSEVSAAWHQTDHTDPGPGYPVDVFMGLVQQFIGGDDLALANDYAQAKIDAGAGGADDAGGDNFLYGMRCRRRAVNGEPSLTRDSIVKNLDPQKQAGAVRDRHAGWDHEDDLLKIKAKLGV